MPQTGLIEMNSRLEHGRLVTLRGQTRKGAVLSVIALTFALASEAAGQVNPTTPPPISGHSLTFEDISSADVLARAHLIRDEIELIRFEMGRPTAGPSEFDVRNASPREVMFQAFTLFLKASELQFELAGTSPVPLQLELPQEVRQLHVWRVLEVAYQRILTVRRELDISDPVVERRQPPSAAPTDVFLAIAQANRQLDQLLSERLAPRDVFYQVKLASNYAVRLLQQFPGARVIPPAPMFERGKRPVDVFNLLLANYEKLQGVAMYSRIETLSLEVTNHDTEWAGQNEVSPSEVYNIAILLVSELAYLHAQLDYSDAPTPARDSGVKVPAHVYQQARILQLQLQELEKLVHKNPDWLAGRLN